MKVFDAIIWDKEPDAVGQRVSVLASDIHEARRKLEIEYGEERIITLHNNDDANRIR